MERYGDIERDNYIVLYGEIVYDELTINEQQKNDSQFEVWLPN